MIKLSRKSAEINMQSPVELMTNLKMRLTEVDQGLATKDFYGKVIGCSEEPQQQVCVVRFTSLPPEISAYFEAHREYSPRSGQE